MEPEIDFDNEDNFDVERDLEEKTGSDSIIRKNNSYLLY
jgi:hypothetical protein